MSRRELTLGKDTADIVRIVRVLGSSVNVEILAALIEARSASEARAVGKRARGTESDDPNATGWVFLSDLSKRVGQAPGTVSVAVQKMLPHLVEENYVRGRRYFRARLSGFRIVLDGVAGS